MHAWRHPLLIVEFNTGCGLSLWLNMVHIGLDNCMYSRARAGAQLPVQLCNFVFFLFENTKAHALSLRLISQKAKRVWWCPLYNLRPLVISDSRQPTGDSQYFVCATITLCQPAVTLLATGLTTFDPVSNYTARRHMCVNNLPRVIT